MDENKLQEIIKASSFTIHNGTFINKGGKFAKG
jgi:hypothetical protein